MLDRWTEWSRKCIKVHACTNKQPDTETTVTDCRLKTRWAYKRFRRYKQAQHQPPPKLDSLSQTMTEKWTDSQVLPSDLHTPCGTPEPALTHQTHVHGNNI